MIPVLGLNSAVPSFCPLGPSEGYSKIISVRVRFNNRQHVLTSFEQEVESYLCKITGSTRAPSSPTPGLQVNTPVSVSSGHNHHSRGEGHRDICLIPVSAHGTNPAVSLVRLGVGN